MTRSSYKYIAVLLACALALALGLQILWVMKLVHNSHENLERSFKEAMNSASNELQRHEDVSLIAAEMQLPPTHRQVQVSVSGHHSSILVQPDTAFTTVRIDSSDNGYSKVIVKRIEKTTPGHTQREVTHISINDQVEKIQTKTRNIDTLIQKIMYDYEHKNVELKERLSLQALKTLLNKELLARGLDTNYECAVFNETHPENALMSTRHFSKTTPSYKTDLFKQDVFREKNYMKAYPIHAGAYVWKDLGLVLGLSLLCSLVIIVLFIFTFRAILTQRKLAQIKNDFINNMSHEFKTPLATISLASDTLRNPTVRSDAEQSDYYLGVIKDENRKLRAHLDRILDLAVMEQEAGAFRLTKIDIVQLIHETIHDFDLLIKQANAEIRFTSGAEQMMADADPFYLKHAIHNVIDNALKYSAGTPKIHISAEYKGEEISIHITDHGIGMSTEAQAMAFEKFYRAHTGNLHDVKGFGLGLNYTKHIIQKHHGHISIESKLQQGTTVHIEIPIHGKN